ncbi:MAG: hypothetical protein FJX03_04660 [Alphaproteobacteria bacterium]|nr:hypothetical protein [Alphaproteobacteria bacterium]
MKFQKIIARFFMIMGFGALAGCAVNENAHPYHSSYYYADSPYPSAVYDPSPVYPFYGPHYYHPHYHHPR